MFSGHAQSNSWGEGTEWAVGCRGRASDFDRGNFPVTVPRHDVASGPRRPPPPSSLLAPLRGHRVRHCHLSQPPLTNNALSPVKKYLFLLAFNCKSYSRSIESEIMPSRRPAMGEWGLSGLLLSLGRCLLRDHTLRVDQGWRAWFC
jgi:hypothetical protein